MPTSQESRPSAIRTYLVSPRWEKTPRLQTILSRWYTDCMQNNRKTSHTQFDLKYHLIWTTKYRKPVLTNKVAIKTRDLIREICDTYNIQIIRGHVSKDHIHLFISAPPTISVSKATQYLKGKSSRRLLQEFPTLNKQFWGQHLWGRGYYAVTSGNITDEQVMEYIENQDEDQDKRGDSFTIVDV